MSSPFERDIHAYWAACDKLRQYIVSLGGHAEDNPTLSGLERQVDQLEKSILTFAPTTRRELQLKTQFVRRLVGEWSDDPGLIQKLIGLLMDDMSAFLDRKA
jgi:hypothetical protein